MERCGDVSGHRRDPVERILSAYEFTLEVAARGVHAKVPIKVEARMHAAPTQDVFWQPDLAARAGASVVACRGRST